MDNVEIRARFPRVYDNFVEIDDLSLSEQNLFERGQLEYLALHNNQWVITSDIEGVQQYEKMFDLLPSSSDSLSLRKERIINKLSTAPPYTLRYLKQRLDLFVGIGNYTIILIPNDRHITFIFHIGERGKLDEVIKMLVEILPANLFRVVNNDILCYNTTERYIGGGLSFCMCYILSSNFNATYTIESIRRIGGVITETEMYQLSADFNKTVTANGTQYGASGSSLNTTYEIS